MKIEVLKAFTLPGSPRPFLPRERATIPDKDALRLIAAGKVVSWPFEEPARNAPVRRKRETATRVA